MNRTLKHTNFQQDDNLSGATFGKDICCSLSAVLYYLFWEARLSLKTVKLALSVIYAVNS